MEASVVRALLYLRLTSLRNALRQRLQRLRQPKYLIGGIIGIAYIYFFFIRSVSSPRGPIAPSSSEFFAMFELGGAAAVFVFAALSWIVPGGPTGLAFTETEVAVLFPAPIRRRTLIHYRLLSAQFRLLFSALIFGLVSARWSFAGGFFMRTFSWWIVLATLSLHATAASFAIARLLNLGVTTWPRRILVAGIIALCVWAAFAFRSPVHEEAASFGQYMALLTAEGPLHWLLFVPRLVVAPFMLRDSGGFLLAAGPALLVLAAHYVWVLYSATAFEEASLIAAEKRAARIAALRSGKSIRVAGARAQRKREPFRLRNRGRAETAFLWKNLLAGSSLVAPRTLIVAAFVVYVGCRWLTGRPDLQPFAAVVFSLSFALLMITVLFGPQIARNDLRGDLPNADVLKTYPLRGWQIALGGLLAPALTLTGVLWIALLGVVMTVPEGRFDAVAPESRTLVAFGLALLAPVWCFIQLIVLNTLSLLFPAWLQSVSNRGEHGFDVLGQRILFIAAQLIVVVLAFVPASFVAGTVMFTANLVAGPLIASTAAALAALGVLVAELAVGVVLLGTLFERFDVSNELRA